jgi:aspartyl/asparaginyl-tRNA synthetase
MIEPEIAFADLNDDANLAEAFLKYLFQAVLNERMDDLGFIAERVEKTAISRLENFIKAPFERIDYTEAVKLLQKSGHKFEYPVEWGLDLQTEHERWLTEQHVGRPVVVTNYPEHIKAFYMRLNDDGKTVAAMDVLAPGIGEIIGGSQREERLDILDARIAKFGLDPAHYQWYRDFRRYGTVPHAGFGLGFERLVVYVCRPVQHPRCHPLPAHTGTRGVLRPDAYFPRPGVCGDCDFRRHSLRVLLAHVAGTPPRPPRGPADRLRRFRLCRAAGAGLAAARPLPRAGLA